MSVPKDHVELMKRVSAILDREHWGMIDPAWIFYAIDYEEGRVMADITSDKEEQVNIKGILSVFKEAWDA